MILRGVGIGMPCGVLTATKGVPCPSCHPFHTYTVQTQSRSQFNKREQGPLGRDLESMEGIQASTPFDLSSVVCYYKTINYPSLELSTDLSTRRLFDLKSSKIRAEVGIKEVSNGLVSTRSGTAKNLSNDQSGIKVSSSVALKKAVQNSSPKQQNTPKEITPSPIPTLQTVTSSLVIKNGEILTNSGNTLKLYLVPATQSSTNQPLTKPTRNGKNANGGRSASIK